MSLKLSFKTKFFNLFRSVLKVPFIENIFYRFTRNASPEGIFFKLTPNPYQYPKDDIRRVSRRGINLDLHMNDAMDWFLYFDFKEPSKEKLFELIKPGYKIVDIGANIGETTLNFARLTGAGGSVLSLEPNRGNFEKLKANLRLNNFTNIKIAEVGAGSEHGFFNMVTPEENNTGMMRIREQGITNNNRIEVDRLDSILEKEKITQVDFIKIDVEGYELKVLEGATGILTTMKPALFIELDNGNLKEQDTSAKELVSFLEKMNYRVTRAEDGEKIFSGMNFEKCHYDIYCLSKK